MRSGIFLSNICPQTRLLPIRAERNPSSAKSPAIKAMANFTRQQVRTQVGRILWGQWDPLGVHEDPKAWGSYDAYVSGICALLVRGASDEELTEYLKDLETQHMGLSGSSDAHLTDVVAALRTIGFAAP